MTTATFTDPDGKTHNEILEMIEDADLVYVRALDHFVKISKREANMLVFGLPGYQPLAANTISNRYTGMSLFIRERIGA